MPAVEPYLTFPGNCEEAVNFYCEVLGGEMLFKSTYKDAPMETPENWKNKILHCGFTLRGQQLMASDAFPSEKPAVGNNIQLCLNYDKTDKIDETFKSSQLVERLPWGLKKLFGGPTSA